MNMAKIYYDSENKQCSILQMVKKEPNWAANRIQEGEKAINKLEEIRKNIMKNCHDCDAKPGEIHKDGCDVERCSVCGGQRLQCTCPNHDSAFSRWSGFWPGGLEADALNIDLNQFYKQSYYKKIFIKPC